MRNGFGSQCAPERAHFFDPFGANDVSADSSVESSDRVSLMEVRLQAQEDEITLLKSSLADALRRLHVHEQQIPLLRQHIIAGAAPPSGHQLPVLHVR
uniref:Uncharacterized protein n=1 Tax=Paramormyrops kingsleyae TaxID=1676925 RepID=A0A3B3T4L1_9TELE